MYTTLHRYLIIPLPSPSVLPHRMCWNNHLHADTFFLFSTVFFLGGFEICLCHWELICSSCICRKLWLLSGDSVWLCFPSGFVPRMIFQNLVRQEIKLLNKCYGNNITRFLSLYIRNDSKALKVRRHIRTRSWRLGFQDQNEYGWQVSFSENQGAVSLGKQKNMQGHCLVPRKH